LAAPGISVAVRRARIDLSRVVGRTCGEITSIP
jgi:hypothetical protein